MHFIEDDELDVSNQVSTLVQHASQNLCCHDQAVSFWVDLYVPRQDANRCSAERLLEIAVLLVGQRLNGGRIDSSEMLSAVTDG